MRPEVESADYEWDMGRVRPFVGASYTVRSSTFSIIGGAMVAFLASTIGQIFTVRANEIFTFSQPRPVRSVHVADRWTPESIAAVAIPVLRSSFSALDRTQDVFSWDPI